MAQLPPLDAAVTPEDLEVPLAILAVPGVAAYAFAALFYFGVWSRRRTRARVRGGVRVRAARRGAGRLDPVAADELAP